MPPMVTETFRSDEEITQEEPLAWLEQRPPHDDARCGAIRGEEEE
jgi:hypothetical protein